MGELRPKQGQQRQARRLGLAVCRLPVLQPSHAAARQSGSEPAMRCLPRQLSLRSIFVGASARRAAASGEPASGEDFERVAPGCRVGAHLGPLP